jgi:4'-phosphopantetheinyl transferase
MAVYLLEQSADYQLGIWKMDEDETELLKQSGLSDPPALVNPVRRLEYLAVRAMASVMGIKPADIAYKPSGKPYLAGDKALIISISHTRNYVAVLLSAHALAGVDVEHRSERIRKIRHKFMHPDEENNLKQISNPLNETVGLLLHWCAKESLFKALPEEGVDFAQELRISGLSSPELSGKFMGSFLRTSQTFQIDYQVHADFVLTCSFSTESR